MHKYIVIYLDFCGERPVKRFELQVWLFRNSDLAGSFLKFAYSVCKQCLLLRSKEARREATKLLSFLWKSVKKVMVTSEILDSALTLAPARYRQYGSQTQPHSSNI